MSVTIKNENNSLTNHKKNIINNIKNNNNISKK